MDVKNIKPNTRVELHTKQGDFNSVILESPAAGVILVKLDSGYNIGIREEDILDIKILREKEKKQGKKQIVEFKGSNEIKLKKELPNIALVVTGGTISSKLDYKTGGVKWITSSNELLKFYPELLGIANVSKIEIPFMKASENMNFNDWEKLSEVVFKLLNDPKIEGVIITHGTDFLHYSANALSFSLRNLNKPVVLTYSQRSSDRASSDARLNLICAARAAISDIAEVILVGHANENDDFCFALRGAKIRKMHSSRRDAFKPINSEPIARIFPDKIEFLSNYNKRDDKRKIDFKGKFNDKVALIKFYPGQDPEILEHYLKNKYKGIVIEMSGLGHVITDGKNNWIPKLKKIIKSGLIVCAAPQTLYGRLDPYVYSAGRELEKTGVIYLNDMLPETAFVKLSWILADAKMKKNIKENMLKNFTGEFNNSLKSNQFLN